MRRLPALAALALVGCWPYIGGGWDQYDTPEDVQILGFGDYLEYAGGYWDDSSPSGQLVWGWLAHTSTTVTPLDFVATQEGCTLTEPGWDSIFELMGDPGDESAFIDGPGERIELAWYAADSVFFGETGAGQIELGASYDLVPMDTANVGKFGVEEFIVGPGDAAIDVPVDFAADSIPTGTPADLSFSWPVSSDDPAADYVIAKVHVANQSNQLVETAYCAAEYGRGELVVNPEVFSRDGVGWYVLYGPASITNARIGQQDVSSSMLMVHYTVGYMAEP